MFLKTIRLNRMIRKTSVDYRLHEFDQLHLNSIVGNAHVSRLKVDAWVIIYAYAADSLQTLLEGSLVCAFIREALKSSLPWYYYHKLTYRHYHLKYRNQTDEHGQQYIDKFRINYLSRLQGLHQVIRQFNATLSEANAQKTVGNEHYGLNRHNLAVHQYKLALQLIGTINLSSLFEIMTPERKLLFLKTNLIVNSNLSQCYIKVKESYQAVHYANTSRKFLQSIQALLEETMGDPERFRTEYKLLGEKVDNRYDLAINMIGFLNARFSNVPQEGLKVGSLLAHADNQFPSIFQSSQVLVVKFRRTGNEGSHICEGIIINKPSEFNKKGKQILESDDDYIDHEENEQELIEENEEELIEEKENKEINLFNENSDDEKYEKPKPKPTRKQSIVEVYKSLIKEKYLKKMFPEKEMKDLKGHQDPIDNSQSIEVNSDYGTEEEEQQMYTPLSKSTDSNDALDTEHMAQGKEEGSEQKQDSTQNSTKTETGTGTVTLRAQSELASHTDDMTDCSELDQLNDFYDQVNEDNKSLTHSDINASSDGDPGLRAESVIPLNDIDTQSLTKQTHHNDTQDVMGYSKLADKSKQLMHDADLTAPKSKITRTNPNYKRKRSKDKDFKQELTKSKNQKSNNRIHEKKNKKLKIYVGGPCEMSRQFYLHNCGDIPFAEKVLDGVYIGGQTDFDQLKKREGAVVRGFYGYAAWFEGQLDGELENGDWLLNNSAKAEDVFKDFESVPFVY